MTLFHAFSGNKARQAGIPSPEYRPILLSVLLLFACAASRGQVRHSPFSKAEPEKVYDTLITPDGLRRYVSFLADSLAEGRSSGSRGNEIVRQMILYKFREFGLKKFEGDHTQAFRINDSVLGRNVMGVIPSKYYSEQYIIVGAHFDHIGKHGKRYFPGADDNASGVSVLLNLAHTLGKMKKDRFPFTKNILIVAFDGKEYSMSGAEHFAKQLEIPKENISCMINIDQIGSNLVPPGNDTNYILVLGNERLRKIDRSKLSRINLARNIGLEIDHTFYGSPTFYKLFYKISDHYPFAKKGIPAVLFTSGITRRTYKETDDETGLSYPVLAKRARLIFHFICESVR